MTQRKRKLAALSKPFSALPVEYETTEDNLTASAGLGPVLDLFLDHPFLADLYACLPERLSNASYDSEKFALILIAGFLKGFDCLDDLEHFQNDPLIVEKFGEVPTPKAFGNWLRDFEPAQIEQLKVFLRHHAQFARKQINPQAPMVLDLDSTSHVQHGLKMEGLAYDYEGNWCLSSLMGADELLFAHGFELRAGNTFSSTNSAQMLQQCFAHLKIQDEKYSRGDAAFCDQAYVEQCVRLGVKFTVTAHGRMGWENQMPNITQWQPWIFTQEELEIFAQKQEGTPRIELGSFIYQPGWSDNLRFYVIVKRTWAKNRETGQDRWFHYAILTNWNLFKNSLQEVMQFHHKRGHGGENSIKEFKHAFDLLHFPCQRLSANEVYGLFALIAHNHLRTLALIDNREHPLYAKRFRFKIIHHPGKIIHHSRKTFEKFSTTLMKEVQLMLTGWAETRQTALARAG